MANSAGGVLVSNVFLVGGLNLLWGMFHSLVILAHFPLVNIAMPSNAGVIFAGIMKVATFDIIDTNPLVSKIEEGFGLKWQES